LLEQTTEDRTSTSRKPEEMQHTKPHMVHTILVLIWLPEHQATRAACKTFRYEVTAAAEAASAEAASAEAATRIQPNLPQTAILGTEHNGV